MTLYCNIFCISLALKAIPNKYFQVLKRLKIAQLKKLTVFSDITMHPLLSGNLFILFIIPLLVAHQ